MSTFETAVSDVRPGTVNLRGYPLDEIMRRLSFTDGIFLSVIGRLPGGDERRLMDVLLNSLLDHGFVASTITAARYIASGNPQFIPAVAGGILAAGANTLSPEHSYEMLDRASQLRAGGDLDLDGAAASTVAEYRSAGRRLPGFGHPVHKDADFRADILFEAATAAGLAGESVAQIQAIHGALNSGARRSLPINIDGAMAAVGRDLGWTCNQVVAFAVLSVLPGLMGHVIEELGQNVPLRYIRDGSYVGSGVQPLPAPPNDAPKR